MRSTLFLLVAAMAALLKDAPADDASTAGIDVAAERQQASAQARAAFAEIECRFPGAASPLERGPEESLLKWTNPDVGRVYGDVYLWTDGGRPRAAASIYRWFFPYQSLSVEFASLSERPLRAVREGQTIWRPARAGVDWRPLEGAERPARGSALRLVQMKRLAAQFEVRLVDERTDAAGIAKSPRLLPRPLFRYPETAGIDGAVFAFVVGTDPEILLLLEASPEGWRSALARMNRDAVTVTRDGAAVASFERLDDLQMVDPGRAYSVYVVPEGTVRHSGVSEAPGSGAEQPESEAGER